ncbi:MAG: sodium/solute symporter [Gammaproteobacteria bacterium]
MNKTVLRIITLFISCSAGSVVLAAGNSNGISVQQEGFNIIAASIFVFFIAVTLVITWWAARNTHNTKDFYSAGGRITGFQNGLAIAGDFMSAATFLGVTGLVFVYGFDVALYVLAGIVGFCLLLILLAEPFRNLGTFTLSDAVSYRLSRKPIRAFSGFTSLIIVIMYLVIQMVGAGALIQLLFGLPYEAAVVTIGTLMVIYVSAGGMMATTWVQIIKAVLLLLGITILAVATFYHFNFSFSQMYQQVAETHHLGIDIFTPGAQLTDPLAMISLSVALIFGAIGMPHVLMRLFTVPDVRESYRSVLYSTCFIGYVFCLIFFIIGFGSIVVLNQHPELFDASGRLIGGSNMVAVHLSKVIAGDIFYGFISAIVFATILAVVAGLTIAGASAVSHDIYASVIRSGRASEREEIRVSRIATLVIGAIAIGLGIAFERQNIAYLMTMVFAVSASANFPLLLLSVYWRGITTRGAVIGGFCGLISSVGFVILGPTIWVEILGNESAIFPYAFPALFSMSIGFAVIIIVSLLDNSERAKKDRETFDALYLDIYLGKAVKELAE